MADIDHPPNGGFTSRERDFIRNQLDQYFSSYPTVAEGFQLRAWSGGSKKGQTKIPMHAEGLLNRGLMRLDETRRPARLFFTEAGLEALRSMMRDRRQASPERFAHIREELGIDPLPADNGSRP